MLTQDETVCCKVARKGLKPGAPCDLIRAEVQLVSLLSWGEGGPQSRMSKGSRREYGVAEFMVMITLRQTLTLNPSPAIARSAQAFGSVDGIRDDR